MLRSCIPCSAVVSSTTINFSECLLLFFFIQLTTISRNTFPSYSAYYLGTLDIELARAASPPNSCNLGIARQFIIFFKTSLCVVLVSPSGSNSSSVGNWFSSICFRYTGFIHPNFSGFYWVIFRHVFGIFL